MAEQMAGNAKAAAESLERAAAHDDLRPQALQQLAVAYALDGRTDLAFERLGEAADTGKVDITGFAAAPGLEKFAEDPRFLALLPSAEALDDPFVEEVRVLQQWRGEAAGDQFGWIARNIGDVDGDGIADVVTSAPTHAHEGDAAGKVYVYSAGKGTLSWSHAGPPGSQLGMGLEAAGDVNADGTPDVIAGAPGAGLARVLSGKDGAMLHELTGTPEERFGHWVSDVGDVDGDGNADVLVGAPNRDGSRGAVVLVSGKDGGPMVTLEGEHAGDRFGSAGGGHVGADGRIVVAIGAPDAGPNKRGAVLVFKGKVGSPLPSTPTHVLLPADSGMEFGGMFVSIVGEVDGDGTPDVFVADWSDAAKGPTTGAAYVFSGASGDRLHRFEGEKVGEGLGIGVADAGDLDGDGRTELVFGAWQHGSAAPAGGRAYLHRADGSRIQTWTSKVMGETFGFDATGLGDVDGDGHGDLLFSSAWAPVAGPRTGRVFVVAGPTLSAK